MFYDIPEKTYRVIDILGPRGLNEIATQVYGRQYEGAEAGTSNGTAYTVDATAETLAQYDLEAFTSTTDPDSVPHWLSKPAVTWDHRPPEDYWIPGPDEVIPHLVFKGHLPHGVYLVRLDW
jgi:hypothetical protein